MLFGKRFKKLFTLRWWDRYILLFFLGIAIGVILGIKWQAIEIENCPDAERQLARCDQAFKDLKIITDYQGAVFKIIEFELAKCYSEYSNITIEDIAKRR